MKKVLCLILAVGMLMSLFCVSAAAAETNVASGIYDLIVESAYTEKVTLEAMTATADTPITATTTTINGAEVSGFYANAERVKVTITNLTANTQYLVLMLNDNSPIPTEGNIAYIDQTGATSTSVTFSIFPSELEDGKTYSIWLAGTSEGMKKIGSFNYYGSYTLGDVNSDNEIDTKDALLVVNHFVGNIQLIGNQRLAANVNRDQEIDMKDALLIVNLYVENIDHF